MEDSAATTITTEDATKAAGIWFRAFMRAANHIAADRQAIKDQEAKIAEQAAAISLSKWKEAEIKRLKTILAQMEEARRRNSSDRCNETMKAQAFELGDQDRKIRDLEAKVAEQGATIDKCQARMIADGFQIDGYKATVAELQAGNVGRLRQSVDFQAMEIQRLKAALWYGGKLDQVLIDILGTRPLGHDSEDGVWCWCDPDMDKAIAAKLDAYKGKVAALTEDLAERDRLLRECQAERDEARRKLTLKAMQCWRDKSGSLSLKRKLAN